MNWLEIPSDELLDACQQAGGVALIPVGSLERHGTHLPLGTDAIVIEDVARQVAAQEPVVALPTIPYTFVAQCRFHPGAVHIRSDILLEHLTCICDEIHRNGFSKIVLLHGHGGNVPMSQSILFHVLETGRPYAIYSIPPFAGKMAEITPLLETEHYGHAGELETSVVLAVAPHLVKLDKVAGRYYGPNEEAQMGDAINTPVGWISVWEEMVCGGPDKATVEKGRTIVDLWVQGVVAAIRAIKADTVVADYMQRPTTFPTPDTP